LFVADPISRAIGADCQVQRRPGSGCLSSNILAYLLRGWSVNARGESSKNHPKGCQ
jgi:hypothetical protein